MKRALNPDTSQSEAVADSTANRTDGEQGTTMAVEPESSAPATMAAPASAELKSEIISQSSMVAALGYRDFRYLWAGNFLSNIGTWMQNVAQGWLVLQLTNSAYWLGVVSFASAVPLLIFTLIGGVISDHVDKRKMLIATQVAMMLCSFGLALLTFQKVATVSQIIFLAFATGLAAALAAPSQQALLPQLVPRGILTNAVGLNSAQFNMSRVIGPTAGGFAMAWFGVAGNFFLNGLSFLAVIFALSRMHYPAQSPIPEASLWSRLKEGFQYVLADPKIKVLVMLVGVGGLLGIPYLSFVPLFAKNILNVDARGLGLLMASSGAGAFFAAITIAYVGKPRNRGKIIFICGFLFYAAILAFTFSKSFLISAALQMVAGYFLIIMVAIINTRLQLLSPEDLRGRVMSIYATAYLGLPPIGSYLAGWLSKWITAPEAIAAMAFAGLTANFLIFAANKDLWHLD